MKIFIRVGVALWLLLAGTYGWGAQLASKTARTPDGAVREAVEWLQAKYGNAAVPDLRFISLYNEEQQGEILDPVTQKAEKYSPVEETVLVLLWTVNQLNRTEPIADLIAINDRLFAIDITSAGWTSAAWEKCGQQMTYFSADWVNVAHWNYLTAATQSQVPIFRADEFIAKSTVAPTYYDFVFGVDKVKTKAELLTTLGQNEQFVFDSHLLRAGNMSSRPTVTRHNRRLEFRPGPFWLWTSLDTFSNVGAENVHARLGVLPGTQHELKIAGQEHIFPLRWGGFGSFLNDAAGARIDEVPIQVASDKNFVDLRVRAGRSCMGCHTAAVKSFNSDQHILLRKRIVKLSTVNPEEAKLLQSVYDEIAVQDTLEDQQRAYERALSRMVPGAQVGETTARKFIHAWTHYSDDRLDITRAATCVGVTPQALAEQILPTIDPTLMRLLPQEDIVTTEELKLLKLEEADSLVVNPGKVVAPKTEAPSPLLPTIARDEWEASFRTAMLLFGRPEVPQSAVGLAPPKAATPLPEAPKKPAAQVLTVAKPANGESVTTDVKFSAVALPEVVKYNSDKVALVKVGTGKAGEDTGELKTRIYPVTLTASDAGEFPTWIEFTLKESNEVIRFEVKP